MDNNATTPIAPEVLDAMMPYLKEQWGNPSSSYRFGSKLKSVIEKAREQVADLIGAHPMEVLFTSCATESNNTAIHAALKANPNKRHIVTSKVEHSSVLNHCRALESEGYRVTYLPVDGEGLLKINALEGAMTEDTAVVSLMWANNETGVLFPVEEIANLCKSKGILYHCDAVQAAGKLPIKVKTLPIDYLSLTGHKINAPKGIGALFVRRKALFSSYLHGGHQERGYRGGTENVASIVGLGTAAEKATRNMANYVGRVASLRNSFEESVLKDIPNTEINGNRLLRIANTTNITFLGIKSEALLLLLDQEGICASSGSACLADSPEPSHVISAMRPGLNAYEMIRFSLSQSNTDTEVKHTLSALSKITQALRG